MRVHTHCAGVHVAWRDPGGSDPARARCVEMHSALAGDRYDRLVRLQHGVSVGVEVEVPLRLAGVAPGDDEPLLARRDEVLDRA